MFVIMMNALEILKFPDPRLRNKGQEVTEITSTLVQLAQNMLKVMYDQNGVGLSAIQVNKLVRLFVADTGNSSQNRYDVDDMGSLEKDIKQPLICFNPEIISSQGEIIFNEGCLSFPSYYAEVKRSAIITMKALDIKGRSFTIKTDGLLSVCIQHEIDHLDGKLFIDHLSSVRAQQLRNKIKKYGYPSMEKEKIS